MFEIRNTRDWSARGINILVYSKPGVGKTHMVTTTGDTSEVLVLSVESGLMTLEQAGVDYIEITSFDMMRQLYQALAAESEQFEQYKWVMLDSVTEIAEKCLSQTKFELDAKAGAKKQAHGMQVYGELRDKMFGLLRAFRDLNRNIYMSAKEHRLQVGPDEAKFYQHLPMMPGGALKEGVAYDFDFVANLRWMRDSDGNRVRRLVFEDDINHPHLKSRAKDRVPLVIEPDLGKLASLIRGENHISQEQ